ncbi:MAG: hypothetical protein ACR2QG_07985 [Gammaproteobacteria bacterium]
MELFIVHISAKHGSADSVAQYYADGEAEMKKAPGYRGRKIYQAETGKMVEAVHRFYTPDELARDPEPPHGPQGTDFIIIEYWDSVDERMAFAKQRKQDKKGLVIHLEPDHSHEFFREISNTVEL